MKPTIPNKHYYHYSVTFSLALHIAALHHATAATFAILNNCPHTVWAAAVPGGGSRLDPGQNWTVVLPAGAGRVWARTNCSFSSWTGKGRCLTGDCDGSLQCWVHGKPPASLAEYVLNQTDGLDYLYISLVEGFNVPIELRPTSPVNCSQDEGIRCDANATSVIRRCPRSLRTRGGCRDPCTVFMADEYCCTGAMATNCGPTNFSKFYKRRCPDAYTYPRDDETSTTITCAAGYNSYTVVFCPTPQEQGMPPIQSSTAPAPNPAYSPPGISETSSSIFRPVSSHSHVETGRIAGLVLGASGAGFLLIISTACCIRRRYSRAARGNQNVEKVLFQNGSLSLKRYKYREIKKMTKSLSDKLGQGGYGSVYKGKLPDGSPVAVKVLTADTNSNGEEFINEVASISRTSHVHIVNLLGFCFERKKRALVYEYMANKSLDKYIGGGADHLNSQTLYKIAVGVAKGLEYLHTGCNTRIVHFDIKPQNILLDEDFCPKISDFGLAKLCQKKQSLLSVLGTRGTAGYIAPEVFSRNYGGVSHKSDVYSYGMMVLEMGGGHWRVGRTETSRSKESYFPDTIYELVTDEVCWPRVDHEDETRQKMCLVGFWCIQTKASDRPSMSKVVEMLEGNFESIQIPPKPVLFTPSLPITESSSPFSSHVETEPSGSV